MNKKSAISKINPKFLQGIAHRGLHTKEYTENGKNAFVNAINNDIAFEFDIHLTEDNELVVCHDEDLYRTTGKHGIIEHLSLKEIKENYRLLDGGEILTLEEVISLNNYKVPMVIEFKVFEKNYKALASRAMKTLLPIKNKQDIMLISFDPRSLWPFKNKGFIRSLLVVHHHFYTWMFKRSVESIDIEHVLLEKKKVARYAKRHLTNVWTIEEEKTLEKVLGKVDTITFQHLPVKLIKESLTK